MISDKLELRISDQLKSSTPTTITTSYSVSFNNAEYGVGGYEEEETVDYISNDKNKLIKFVETSDPNTILHFNDKFDLFFDEDGDVIAVLFENETTFIY